MKHNTLDPTHELELTIQPDYQKSEFTIVGPGETVLPIAEAVQAQDARQPVHSATKRGKHVLQAFRQSEDTFLGRVAMDTGLVIFDKLHDTNLLAQKRRQRLEEKIVKKAVSVNLISMEDTFCQKHKHAVDTLLKVA